MPLVDALAISTTPEDARSATEQEVFVDFQELLFPEVFLVKDVCAENFSRHAARQILKSFAGEPPFDCSVVLSLS